MTLPVDLDPTTNQLRIHPPEGAPVLIPCTQAGLAVLVRLVRERAGTKRQTIGAPAVPVQHMVEQWLRENPPTRVVQVRPPNGLTYEEVFGDDPDFELDL